MTESLKAKIFELVQTSFLWFVLLSAFLYTNYLTDSLQSEIGPSNEQIIIVITLLALGGLLLGILSMAAPPFKHFLAAQFESGDVEKSLSKIQERLSKVESKINELNKLIQELAEHIVDDD